MFRTLLVVAVVLFGTEQAFAGGHGGGHGGGEAAPAAPPPPKDDPTLPKVTAKDGKRALVDPKGMTLYYFERDTAGNKSTCDGKCAEKWIPVPASADAVPRGDFTVITRNDGSKMWAYRYRPLYTSHQDRAPGDANGMDPDRLWHIAKP